MNKKAKVLRVLADRERKAPRWRFLGLVMWALAVMLTGAPAQQAWAVDTLLHTFTGSPDGDEPHSNLVADGLGNLYGVTPYGGANGYGALFIDCAPGTVVPAPCPGGPGWKEFVLYSFKGIGAKDGANPYGTLILAQNAADKAFTLFGTTEYGGNPLVCAGQGCGTVFELCAPKASGGCAAGKVWTEKILHKFGGGAMGPTRWQV
jgi:hypothetical protein